MLTASTVAGVLAKLSQVDFVSLSTAFQARGLNLQADEDAAGALIEALSDVGVAIPGGAATEIVIAAAAEIIALVLTYGSQNKPGAQLDPSIFGGDKPRGSNEN